MASSGTTSFREIPTRLSAIEEFSGAGWGREEDAPLLPYEGQTWIKRADFRYSPHTLIFPSPTPHSSNFADGVRGPPWQQYNKKQSRNIIQTTAPPKYS